MSARPYVISCFVVPGHQWIGHLRL